MASAPLTQFNTNLENDKTLWASVSPRYINNGYTSINFFRGEVNLFVALILRTKNDTISSITFYPTVSSNDKLTIKIVNDNLELWKVVPEKGYVKNIYVESVQELYKYIESVIKSESDAKKIPDGYFDNLPHLTSLQMVLDNMKKQTEEIIIDI